MNASQLDLFRQGGGLGVDATFGSTRRIALARDAWLDFAPGLLAGSDVLFDLLRDRADWHTEERVMYQRTVTVPRLVTFLPEGRRVHPMVDELRAILERRYATAFPRVSAALYRDGNDSVAWHGDTLARRMTEALVATVSLGGERCFRVRPTGGGPSIALTLRSGDLVVMGGTAQRTHQHCIPKVAHAAPRIALMFRPTWNEADATW